MKNHLLLTCAMACLLALPIAAPAQDRNGGNGSSQPSPPPSGQGQSSQSRPSQAPSGLPSLADQTPPVVPPGPLSVEQADALCRGQWKAYLNSLACFAPFRHSAHVLDVEAFKYCRVVKEPDCPRP